jgi:hypothetical protein
MITVIIQIVLIVIAWGKGWKGYALIPTGATLSLGFFLGLALGASGHEAAIRTAPFFVLGLLFDLGAIGVLIYMICRPRVLNPVQGGQ